jgi:hypothetical protein
MKTLRILFLLTFSAFCQAQTTQTNFEKQLLELLKYSDNEFKEIKGEAIQGTTDEFKSTYKMDGAIKNIIWYMGWKYFIATYPKTEDSTEAYTAFGKMQESIKKVLGDNATVKATEEEKALTSSIYIKRKTIQYRKHNGESTAYYVLIELERSSSDGYAFTEKVRHTKWAITIRIYQDFEL